MIQRVQTIFLLTNLFFLMTLYLFFELKSFALDIFNFEILININLYLIFCSLITLISIFLFKNRTTQLFLNKIQIFFHFISLLLFFLELIASQHLNSIYKLLIPIFPLILLFLANNFIKKDEDLIKSIDRIR
ncbi:MAG: hypothetical protein CMC57_06805 [Flavobacteriaceae bacterium]|nr:hypothetical protein [Flavobacteriaceae bacterium]